MDSVVCISAEYCALFNTNVKFSILEIMIGVYISAHGRHVKLFQRRAQCFKAQGSASDSKINTDAKKWLTN